MIAIRRARREDIARIVEIETGAFEGDRLSRLSLLRYLGSARARMLVAAVDGVVAGYALIGLPRGGRQANLYSIAVDAAIGRRGAGRALMQACEREAAALGRTIFTLEVRTDNPAAIALYQRLGYQAFGSIPDYYEDGATALRFRKTLPAPT